MLRLSVVAIVPVLAVLVSTGTIAQAGLTEPSYQLNVDLNVQYVGPVVLSLSLFEYGVGTYVGTGTSTATAFASQGVFENAVVSIDGLSGISNFPFGPATTLSFSTNLAFTFTSDLAGTTSGTLYGFDPFANQWVTAIATGAFSFTAVPAPSCAIVLVGALRSTRRRR
ncbi:MAG: hypothetical protein O2800_07525 [Planctomycetota bacterium]|nr:hypothetical protein [Planctomycetota bacterium]